jgi:hypothetical protein
MLPVSPAAATTEVEEDVDGGAPGGCHTLVLRNETEASVRVPRMFKSHVHRII